MVKKCIHMFAAVCQATIIIAELSCFACDLRVFHYLVFTLYFACDPDSFSWEPLRNHLVSTLHSFTNTIASKQGITNPDQGVINTIELYVLNTPFCHILQYSISFKSSI